MRLRTANNRRRRLENTFAKRKRWGVATWATKSSDEIMGDIRELLNVISLCARVETASAT